MILTVVVGALDDTFKPILRGIGVRLIHRKRSPFSYRRRFFNTENLLFLC